MKLYDKFIGKDETNTTLYYTGSDTKESFVKNLEKQKEEWYYREVEIAYSYNEYGHRSKSFKDLDFDNYILFSGCSNTEGVGLELKNTYAYQLSRSLDCDYYNLGLESTGLDVVEFNLISWFNHVKYKPKCVILQWPDPTRFIDYDKNKNNIIPQGTWLAKSENYSTPHFFSAAELSGFLDSRRHLVNKLLRNIIDVPFYTVSISNLKRNDLYSLNYKPIDRARDLIHPGIKSNEALHKLLLDNIAR